MATGGLYGNSGTGALIAESGAETPGLYGKSPNGSAVATTGTETSGLYGNTVNFGGTFFEWFIFQQSATQPATPTGGTWDFVTSTGTPPTGWTISPPSAPTNEIWVSIAFVNSKTPTSITWSVPGLMGVVATTNVGTTTTGAPGTSASVTNSGTAVDAVLNFTIPRGDTGATGATGTAATIAVGTTTTLNPGVSATVTNSGSSSAAVFNFGIPKGAGVNAGGTTGQVLTKASGTDYDTAWTTITGTLNYQGAWNASTNSPTLTSSVGTNGYYYVVNVAGTTNLNGITDWQVGDWAIFNGSIWQKLDQTNLVTSVNGQTGAVSITPANIGALTDITSTDGSVTITSPTSTTRDLSVALAASTNNVICQVRNTTGATLTKGTAVYISGATGQIPTVSKALATSDATSAQTLGLMTADLPNNTNGNVTIIGLITEIDTSAYSDGQQLYLSGTTAGALTGTKTYAPIHLVYVAVVEYAHPIHGKLFVKVQNGYELDEIHNVSAQTPSNGNTIIWNASTNLWQAAGITAGTGVSVTNGAGSITVANTGVTSAVAGTGISVSGATGAVTITNSAPDQTVALTGGTGITTSGTYPNFTITNSLPDRTVALTGAGTTTISGTYPNFTITSTDAYTGTVTAVTGTAPINSTGGTAPAISLAANYGDTQNPYASKTANYVLAAPNGSAGVPTFRAIVAADIPTLNQNTTGTAANITATSNSTLTTLSALSLPYSQLSGTVPTWNQNTTGTAANITATSNSTLTTLSALSLPGSQVTGNISGNAANVTGTVAIANGGTGATTVATAQTNLQVDPAGTAVAMAIALG